MKIAYITPYALDLNIGRAYNEAIEDIQGDETWVVLRDGDTMFLTPDWGQIVAKNIHAFGGEYVLMGAMTNRVGEHHHLTPGVFDEMDLRNHLDRAEAIKNKGAYVRGTLFDIAGFFMAFQKKTWREVGGFPENTPVFDRMFTRKVRKLGKGKVGVMENLYVLHAYRLWASDPVNDTNHLFLNP